MFFTLRKLLFLKLFAEKFCEEVNLSPKTFKHTHPHSNTQFLQYFKENLTNCIQAGSGNPTAQKT